MRQTTKYTVFALIVMIAEFAFGKYLALGAAVPRLTFCVITFFAMFESNKDIALIFGVLSGILYDLMGGHGFGTYTIFFGIAAWETALLCDSIFSSKYVFMIINTFIMSIFAECFYFILHIIAIGAGAFWPSFSMVIVPTALFNTVLLMVLYKPMLWLFFKRR